MNLTTIEKSTNSLRHNSPLSGIALTRAPLPFDLELGKDHYNALRRMLKRALTTARNAERRIVEQQAEIERLQKLSVTDATTELLNRRGFLDSLNRAIERGRRYGEPAVLLLIDLDGFKQINDTYGHSAGDFVLSVVAASLKSAVRLVDDVARIGGDEFAVIMNKMPHQNADIHVKAIEDTLNGLAARWGHDSIPIRASVGSQCFGQSSVEPAEVLYARADNAMYRKKDSRHALPPAAE